MKLININVGAKTEDRAPEEGEKQATDLKALVKSLIHFLTRFEAVIVIILVGCFLTFCALKMLGYVDPPVDEDRARENITNFKKITIDKKTVDRIKQLTDSRTTTGTNFQTNRENPFSENQ